MEGVWLLAELCPLIMAGCRTLLLGVVALLLGAAGRACTTFCLVDDERIVYGRNFDYYTADGRVMVNRRGLQKFAFRGTAGLQWVSRFGSLTFNQFGQEFPNGGLNEAGLVLEHMLLESGQYPSDARPGLAELQWIQYQLDCSASVAEVLASDAHLRILPGSTPLHFLVADRAGHRAVIEFIGGRRVCHTDDTLPVAALTNDTYDNSYAYAATISPERASHVSSLGRFVQAAASVRAFTETDVPDAVSYAFAALANVNQPNWTRWSIVYDIGNMTASFRTLPSPAIKRIRLDALDFRPEAPVRMMDINTYAFGDVTPQEIYSEADNLAVLTSVYRQTTPLAGVSASYIRERAAYPDSVRVAALPVITAQPRGRSVAAGEAVELAVAASAGAAVQWLRNGRVVAGATTPTLRINSLQPASAGIYTATLTNSVGTTLSEPAIVGLTLAAKMLGAVREYAADIRHAATGNVYDQFLATGAAASVTADPGQVARISFIDLGDDIVQVEFSGPGTLTLLLDDTSGPAAPAKYNQDVPYMRGHATVILAGASANTCVSIFSVGLVTNPGVIRAGEIYDGHAELAALAVQSSDGHFGAIRCGNASFCGSAGAVGILASGVAVDPGPVNLHDLCAGDSAIGYLQFGAVPRIQVTGGDLYQINGGAIRSAGVAPAGIALVAGTSSAGVPEPARPLRGRIERDGLDDSGELVIGP